MEVKNKLSQIKYLLMTFLIVFSLFFFNSCGSSKKTKISQKDIEKSSVLKSKGKTIYFGFPSNQKSPIYPGCRGIQKYLRKCLKEKVKDHFRRNFNTKIIKKLGLKGKQRAIILFTIDKSGRVVNIRTSKRTHKKIRNELERVAELLPKMIPGENDKGEKIEVKYILPLFLNR